MKLAGVFLAAMLAAGVSAGAAEAAPVQTFAFTGDEQAYTVPPNVSSLVVTATGAAGGGPLTGGLTGGPGAIASGVISATPGETLYVEVGGVGGIPAGGFNGGGAGATQFGLSVYGGGGASDVRTEGNVLPDSLRSRVLVAGGGGGSAYPAAAGGPAGQPGGSSSGSTVGGGAGTETMGGAGGCDALMVGCGTGGFIGFGGAGGMSGDGAQAREGAGGGGGLYGGGGGAGVLDGNVGGGGGGSSLVPPGGTVALAQLTTPPSVTILPLDGNRPIDPSCMGTTVTSFVQAFGSIAAAARAFGVTVQQGIDNLLAGCATGSH